MALIKTTKAGKRYYIVRWNYRDRSIDGKPYDESAFRKRADALAFMRGTTASTSSQTERVTIAQLCDAWIEQHVSSLEISTRNDYRQQVNLRIRPQLGAKKAAKLTPLMVHQWQQWMVQQGTGAVTANKALRIFKAMLRWGRRVGLTETRAADDIKQLPEAPVEKQPVAYTPQEIDHIANSCALLRDATLIKVGAYSGLRAGEIFALHWKDVDLDAATIHVCRDLDPNRRVKERPKTKKGRRTVELLADGAEALKLWREHAPQTQLVFPDAKNRPLADEWYDEIIATIRDASGVPEFTLAHLRDTFATFHIESGVSESFICRVMGHASIATTHKHYRSSFEQRDKSANAATNELIKTLRKAPA